MAVAGLAVSLALSGAPSPPDRTGAIHDAPVATVPEEVAAIEATVTALAAGDATSFQPAPPTPPAEPAPVPTTEAPTPTTTTTTTEAPPTTTTTTEAPPTTAPPTTAPPTTAPPTTAPPPPPPPPPDPEPEPAPSHGDPYDPATWDRLAGCEAGGNWHIDTGNGYYGGLQFSLESWQGVGGPPGYPHEHPRETQIEMGIRLWEVQGWSAWPSCSRQLGYR